MKLVADANVLFSALLKEGTTRRLWFDSNFILYSPTFLLTEFLSHKRELLKKFDGTEEELDELLERLLKHVVIINESELKPFLPAAASLSSDSKDWLYLASALHANADLWSSGKGFSYQNRVSIWTTSELLLHAEKIR